MQTSEHREAWVLVLGVLQGELSEPEGDAVEVDNLGPHWVRNLGKSARIHLIFEYYDADQPDPDWLQPFLLAGAGR